MPLPLIAIILVAAVGLAVTVVAIVKWADILRWFQSRNEIKESDAANIAFTINAKLETGEYKVVQGIFNKESQEIVEGRAMEAKELDAEFEQVHAGEELIIYE